MCTTCKIYTTDQALIQYAGITILYTGNLRLLILISIPVQLWLIVILWCHCIHSAMDRV